MLVIILYLTGILYHNNNFLSIHKIYKLIRIIAYVISYFACVAEVRILQGIKRFYGADTVDLIEVYMTLSNEDKKKLKPYANDVYLLYGIK